jgi:hypothetical protein
MTIEGLIEYAALLIELLAVAIIVIATASSHGHIYPNARATRARPVRLRAI